MAAYLQKPGKVSIVVMLKILGESASSVFSGKTTYKNVRICRIMAVTAQKEFQNSPQDWNVFSRMSPHLRSALKRRGITTYELAIQFAEAISNVIGMPSYTLNDFSIYTCLLDRSKEQNTIHGEGILRRAGGLGGAAPQAAGGAAGGGPPLEVARVDSVACLGNT